VPYILVTKEHVERGKTQEEGWITNELWKIRKQLDSILNSIHEIRQLPFR
jgi:hypothetical protein